MALNIPIALEPVSDYVLQNSLLIVGQSQSTALCEEHAEKGDSCHAARVSTCYAMDSGGFRDHETWHSLFIQVIVGGDERLQVLGDVTCPITTKTLEISCLPVLSDTVARIAKRELYATGK